MVARDKGSMWLPDFCRGERLLSVVLVAGTMAFLLALAGPLHRFWITFAIDGLFFIWIALISAGVLCIVRRWLRHLSPMQIGITAWGLLTVTLVALAEATWWTSHATDLGASLIPSDRLTFLFRTASIGAISAALVLRYIYIQQQWKQNVQREARARIEALQARIRPHFLFNSMNTIAALVRGQPKTAEQAIEDLADLFRASIADAQELVLLSEELEFARLYQRIEALRLGERLSVRWDTDQAPPDARVPRLLLQPLLENAIYHGIEPMPEGGEVEVDAWGEGSRVHVVVRNPVGRGVKTSRRGHRMAQANIRERLDIAYKGKATLTTGEDGSIYEVRVSVPYRTEKS